MSLNLLISVVDDDESVRLSLEGLIRSLGYAVRCFASGEEFLGSDAHRSSACIVCDIQMPGMNGLELHRQLKAKGVSTPIIFITAYADESVRMRAMNGGARCFLKKPFDAAALIDCITVSVPN